MAALKKRWASKPVATKKAVRRKRAVKVAPATVAKKVVKRTAAKVAATPKRPALAKTKHPVKKVKKAAKKLAPATAQPTAVAEAASTPEVVDV